MIGGRSVVGKIVGFVSLGAALIALSSLGGCKEPSTSRAQEGADSGDRNAVGAAGAPGQGGGALGAGGAQAGGGMGGMGGGGTGGGGMGGGGMGGSGMGGGGMGG